MKYLIVFFILFTLVWASDLKTAINLILQNNTTLLSLKENIKKANTDILAIQNKQLPSLYFDTSYKYISEVSSITIPSIPPQTLKLGQNNNYDLGLSSSYKVFNGFAKENSVHMVELTRESMLIEQKKKEKEIALQTATLWKNIESLLLQTRIISEGQSRVKNQLQKIRSMQNNGIALSIDVLSLELTLLGYEQKLLEIEANQNQAEDSLKILANQRIAVPTPEPILGTYDIVSLNLNNIEELQLLDIKSNFLLTAKKTIDSINYPEFSVNASYRYGKPGINQTRDEWMNYFTVGGLIRWNIWDWNSRSNENSGKDNELTSLELQKKHVTEQIIVNYQASLRDYYVMLKKGELLNKTIDINKERLHISEEQFISGKVTATDFRNAEKEYLESQLTYEQHLVRIMQKRIELDYLSGKEINNWRL